MSQESFEPTEEIVDAVAGDAESADADVAVTELDDQPTEEPVDGDAAPAEVADDEIAEETPVVESASDAEASVDDEDEDPVEAFKRELRGKPGDW